MRLALVNLEKNEEIHFGKAILDRLIMVNMFTGKITIIAPNKIGVFLVSYPVDKIEKA